MKEVIIEALSQVPPELSVFLLSMAPITELRAAIPVGLGVYDLSLWVTMPLVLIGNMIPAFVILYGWDWFIQYCSRHFPWLEKILNKWYQKTQVQWDAKIEKYGPWALVLFVAVPLPGSGVWSGSLAAWIFKLEKKNALISIFIGILLSSAIVIALTLGGIGLFSS